LRYCPRLVVAGAFDNLLAGHKTQWASLPTVLALAKAAVSIAPPLCRRGSHVDAAGVSHGIHYRTSEQRLTICRPAVDAVSATNLRCDESTSRSRVCLTPGEERWPRFNAPRASGRTTESVRILVWSGTGGGSLRA